MSRMSSLAHVPQGIERNSAIPTANFRMNEIRKLPEAEQFAARVSEGAFDDLAAEAVKELREQKNRSFA